MQKIIGELLSLNLLSGTMQKYVYKHWIWYNCHIQIDS